MDVHQDDVRFLLRNQFKRRLAAAMSACAAKTARTVNQRHQTFPDTVIVLDNGYFDRHKFFWSTRIPVFVTPVVRLWSAYYERLFEVKPGYSLRDLRAFGNTPK
jgi:hypothetical protein